MRVAILGGGYAGMAAAVTLAQRGIPVTVFEAAGHLGGRARRIEYRGATLDNGLHILIGAYRETLRLIHEVHPDPSRALMRFPLEWHIDRAFHLRAAPLPAPLHLAAGLATASGTSISARLAAIRMMRGLKARRFLLSHDMSVAELLATERQDPALSRLLWHPLCVAALNTPVERASAQVFVNVLRDTLNARRADSDILLARCDLSALFPDPAAQFVRRHGGEILIGHTVSAVTAKEDGFEVHARGEARRFTQVICALSPHRMASVVAGLPALTDALRMIARFEYQPIYSVYLQYPEAQRLPAPMIGLNGAITQWVFDRAAICGEPGRLGAVISAAGPHEGMPQEALAARVHAELNERFGPLPPPAWSRVIAEKRATFACTPGLERPMQRTLHQGFYLAGDYVAGDYPATLEAAVRSGIQAAQMIAG